MSYIRGEDRGQAALLPGADALVAVGEEAQLQRYYARQNNLRGDAQRIDVPQENCGHRSRRLWLASDR